jgi:hypothetical protein
MDVCERGQSDFALSAMLPGMSRRNGDRARFQKERKKKLLRRQRIQTLMADRRKQLEAPAAQRPS